MSVSAAVIHATAGVDVAPIIAGVAASLGGSAVAAGLTLRRTNRKLAAEGENLYQQALAAAEERGANAVATIDQVRRMLEERLGATERELAETRAQLREAEANLRAMAARTDALDADRARVIAEAQRERDLLQHRIGDLEQQVADLQRLGGGGRRLRDRHRHDQHDQPPDD